MSVFARVPAVRDTEKHFGLKCWQVIEKLSASGRFDYSFMVDVETESGEIVTTSLRWTMTIRSPKQHNWSMALLMNNKRIDCIDWEATVKDHRGHKCTGWHRHIWDVGAESCEATKECLSDFGTHQTVSEFITDACKVLRIILVKEGEYERGETGLLFV